MPVREPNYLLVKLYVVMATLAQLSPCLVQLPIAVGQVPSCVALVALASVWAKIIKWKINKLDGYKKGKSKQHN